LIRLAGDFPYVTYVLAFDAEIVAAALGEAYEDGDAAAGRRFIEKIVQSPLHLPRASTDALRKMAFEGVDAVLNANKIELTERQSYGFANNFASSFEPLLHTPRQAKLYENAITFAVPILKGEIDVVDLLLVEGIRTFVPRLYLAIRDHPDLFLRSQRGNHASEDRLNKLIDGAFDQNAIGAEYRQAIRDNVLAKLFPRTTTMGYGDEWDRIWAKDKLICASDYFQRYFSYGVPTGDIPDRLIDQVVMDAQSDNQQALSSHFELVSAQSTFPALLRRLRAREDTIPTAACVPLIKAFALTAKALPREPASMFPDWTIMQTAILTAHLAQKVEQPQEQITAAHAAVRDSTSFIYSIGVIQWTHRSEEKGKTYGFLDEVETKKLAAIVMDKLVAEAGDMPLYRFLGDDTVRVLLPWSWFCDQDALKMRIAGSIQQEGADGAEALIQVCCGRAWEMATGIPSVSDVRADVYKTIAQFVEPALLLEELKKRYGAKLDKPEFHPSRDVPLGERLALQFAFAHQQQTLKEPAESQTEGD
jgi:hypothetical protein